MIDKQVFCGVRVLVGLRSTLILLRRPGVNLEGLGNARLGIGDWVECECSASQMAQFHLHEVLSLQSYSYNRILRSTSLQVCHETVCASPPQDLDGEGWPM